MKILLGVFACADAAVFPVKGTETLQPDSLKLCGVTRGLGMKPGSDMAVTWPSVRGFIYAGGSGPAEPRRVDWAPDLPPLSSVFEAAVLGSRLPQPWKRETNAGPPGSEERRGVSRGSTERGGGPYASPRMPSPAAEFVWAGSLGKELPKSSSTVICFTTEWLDCGAETNSLHTLLDECYGCHEWRSVISRTFSGWAAVTSSLFSCDGTDSQLTSTSLSVDWLYKHRHTLLQSLPLSTLSSVWLWTIS